MLGKRNYTVKTWYSTVTVPGTCKVRYNVPGTLYVEEQRALAAKMKITTEPKKMIHLKSFLRLRIIRYCCIALS